MTEHMATTGPVVRGVEARAVAGMSDELLHRFATVSVEVVRDKAGNEGYFFGPSMSDGDEVVIFASVWRDLASIKACFGTDWERSYLPEGYADLIEDHSVRHFDARSGWHLPGATIR